MSPITGGPAGEWPTRPRVLDADPDTPTADAPADTDLREQIAAWLYDRIVRQERGLDEKTWEGCPDEFRNGWLADADALLPLVRAQVEAARRDALDAVAHEIASSFPINGELRPDGTADPQAAAYVEGLRDSWSIVRDRAARGETRQP